MIKYIKLTKNLFKLFKSKIKFNEILVYDNNLNFILLTDKIIKDNEFLELDIIYPIFLYNKNDDVIDKIYNFTSDIKCKYQLRDDQTPIVNKILDIHNIYSSNAPIYISLVCPCGFGKTILSIDILCNLKYKCAIIVPRKFIIKQWVDKIEDKNNIFMSLDGRKSAIDKINNNLKCDIFICPDKHLENENIRNYIYDNFSMIIIDEAHRYNLNKNITMTRFLYNNIFKFCIFLTATPSNNMNAFVQEHIEVCSDLNKNINVNKNLVIFEMKQNEYKKYNNSQYNYSMGKINNNNFKNIYTKNYYYKYLLSLDEQRNNDIIEIIYKNTILHNTKALILTDYRDHMKTIYNLLKKTYIKDDVYIYDVEDKKCNDLFTSINKDKYIIISTISACSESLDINNLNTFHMLLPITNMKTLTQCAGRILRDFKDDKYIYIYNFSYTTDTINMYNNDKTLMAKMCLSEWKCNELKCS
ncbi:DNA helicase, transcript release factor [Adoxophyes honmai entomopoxvirus 'L']|uniref:Early transcription factor 70 kDa subunit n=1 Tax=Adoxophyes honmai entomopoxvirus 'L' TaxID=1293540 RepID=A0A916NWN9_9POXV|nr:DNA helicase, transcript release factor [Adoxophyes honmai entomopoxvirus 'L']CCU55377.1 DNA helicase, transcript release factor [Adoxophyes honmai entomopoxvirus 'L']